MKSPFQTLHQDEVKGQIELKLHYKFMADWDVLYKGVLSFQQHNWKTAEVEITQALQKVFDNISMWFLTHSVLNVVP